MQNNSELVHRENFLLVQEYLAYLLNKKGRIQKLWSAIVSG